MMNENARKRAQRSPNYPLQPLKWAIDCGLTLLEKENLHSVPVDIVASNLGYKDANNGSAGRALANLKAFGILVKAPGGKLAVSPDVQRYKLTPNENDKISFLKQWIKKPLLYSKLIEKYSDALPSDAVLIYELVDEHGFNEDAAQKAIAIFRESQEFVASKSKSRVSEDEPEPAEIESEQKIEDSVSTNAHEEAKSSPTQSKNTSYSNQPPPPASGNVRYPVRLAGGRMAYIDVPDPFYEKDKAKLNAQLEIIGTVDEDNDFEY